MKRIYPLCYKLMGMNVLFLEMSDKQSESKWVRITGQISVGDVFHVCCGLPDQEDEVEKFSSDFKGPWSWWGTVPESVSRTAGHKHYKRYLKSNDDYLLIWMIKVLMKECVSSGPDTCKPGRTVKGPEGQR